jgi:D-xylonolactonase
MTLEAKVVERIEFPVAKISSVTFGGPGLDTLYVTTAGGSEGSESADGTLYRLKTRARGRPEFRSKVAL